MERWDKKGLPHKGWNYISTEDFEDDYQTCEMCGKTNIRYLHYLKHSEVADLIGVGCECASKLCSDYVDFKQHEKSLKNRYNRKKNFFKQQWYPVVSQNGNKYLALKYKGIKVGIILGKYGKYGILYPGSKGFDFSRNLKSLDDAKLELFRIVFD